MRQITVLTRAKNWLGLGRVFPRIRERGFEITLIAQEGNILTCSSCVNRVISIPEGGADRLWVEAILSMQGSKFLVGDDKALDWLLIQSQTNQAIQNLVTASLGNINDLQTARGKLQLSRCAKKIGVAVPETIPLSEHIDTGFLVSILGWPLVFKSGYGYAGNEVFDQAAEGDRLFALFPQSSLYPVEPALLKAAVMDKPSNDPGLLAAIEQLYAGTIRH